MMCLNVLPMWAAEPQRLITLAEELACTLLLRLKQLHELLLLPLFFVRAGEWCLHRGTTQSQPCQRAELVLSLVLGMTLNCIRLKGLVAM